MLYWKGVTSPVQEKLKKMSQFDDVMADFLGFLERVEDLHFIKFSLIIQHYILFSILQSDNNCLIISDERVEKTASLSNE
jgi:hypothetical protein